MTAPISQPQKPPRIIVADDHEWIRNILVDIVTQTLPKAEVVIAEDGLQALEAFQESGADFIVSNHCMPRMDGMTLIRTIRQHRPELPILMVSVKPDAKEDAMAAGASWFLRKEQVMEHMPPLLLGHTSGGG